MSREEESPDKQLFSYEEAAGLLPEVQRITAEAVSELDRLAGEAESPEADPEHDPEYQKVISGWAEAIIGLGAEVKGLWLVDFDSGSGYYCWQHPEPALQFFHGYEEGFRGRVQLN